MNEIIELIADAFKLILILALAASGLTYLFNPARGRDLLMRTLLAAVTLSIVMIVFNCLMSNLTGVGATLFLPLLLLLGGGASLAAYWIREVRRRRGRAHPELRGAERTPLLPHHIGEED